MVLKHIENAAGVGIFAIWIKKGEKIMKVMKVMKEDSINLPNYQDFEKAFLNKIRNTNTSIFKKEILILNSDNHTPQEFYQDLQIMVNSKDTELLNIVKDILIVLGL